MSALGAARHDLGGSVLRSQMPTMEIEMSMQERDKRIAEAHQAIFKQPFAPSGTPERPLQPDVRVANALEYIAAQLGTIARAAERIAEHYPKKKD